ncbi:2395_t:CDS:1 [Acaulospora colombiana]|uniref:2395_t:CDS:1 n=1 Tax=Acaulospora colombiana TaxID=27376 RepID=A0ACA9MD98_9GLOM|nr:2395_t:CDS:1 [Acaulospora colombiana]
MSSSPNQTNTPSGVDPFREALNQSLIAQAPDLGPSVVFLILFALSSVIYAFRSFKTRRLAYYYLFGFAILRTAAYITRAVWSQDVTSSTDAIAGGVIASGGFFLAAQSLYVLFTVWVASLHGGSENLPSRDKRYIQLIKLLLPLSSLIGIIGSVKQYSASSLNDYNLGTTLRKVSVLGFAGLLALLIGLTALYSIQLNGFHKLPASSILCTGSLLLMIEMIYRIDAIWSNSKADVNTQKWVFYVFLSIPEFIFSVFMGVVNIEKIFYEAGGDSGTDREKGDH